MTNYIQTTAQYLTALQYEMTRLDRYSNDNQKMSALHINDVNDLYVELRFTLFGDYVGSTIEKSNNAFMSEHLTSELKLDLNSEESPIRYQYDSYGTCSLVITGQLSSAEAEYILDCCIAYLDYPLLCDMHYSFQQINDCAENFLECGGYEDLIKSIESYDISDNVLDSLNALSKDELYSILLNECPSTENLDMFEANACSYYDFDCDDIHQDVIDYLENN